MGKGIGMGMAISYQIINEKHRGKLKLNYLPGKGTEFKII
jgi:signal transduction histidine kinase